MHRLPIVESRRATPVELPETPAAFQKGRWPRLADAMGRSYDYLRLSVTDRCDLACRYCMPPHGEREHALRRELMTFEESLRVAAIFSEMGVKRIRITGGEPLVRKGVDRLIGMIARLDCEPEVVMTTNATLLADRAASLAAAGLRGVNVSLDSLDAERFRAMTRGGDLARVLAGIRAAIAAGMEVKLNTVVIGGENDDELEALVDFAWSLGVTPRFIELMPLGQRRSEQPGEVVPTQLIVERLGSRLMPMRGRSTAGRGPARYLDAADGSGRKVGFISAITDEFCADCNRVRINALGEIRACLASRKAISLRDLIRAGASDDRIAWAAHWALRTKDVGHRFNDALANEHERVGMSLIGG